VFFPLVVPSDASMDARASTEAEYGFLGGFDLPLWTDARGTGCFGRFRSTAVD
jgi:hypothetical protein